MLLQNNNPDFLSLPAGLKNNLRLSIIEGGFSTIMGTLIGGAFLTGFSLLMGADNFIIGVLASLPLLANLVQIVGSYIINRVGDTKKVCISYVILHRIIWLVIVLSPFLLLRVQLTDIRIWILVFMLGIASIFASISSVSWNSWMAGLVPQKIRGRFFARRNIVTQVVAMVVSVLAGWFIDFWNGMYYEQLTRSYAFALLFAIGTVFGFISVLILKKIGRSKQQVVKTTNFLKQLKKPLQDKTFSRFILFTSAWGFAVSLVGPFFSVYMISNLNISFSLITVFGVIASLTGIIGMRVWGNFIDRYGAKTLLYLSSFGASIIPVLWIFASPENYQILWVINMVSGFFWAGIGLASTNMMMDLAPVEDNAVYFAVFSAITGFLGALAPIIGGDFR